MSDEPASIESVFRRVNREIWIVTAADGERRGGLVATWVSQASIDPKRPVVAAAIAVNHFTRELIDAGGALAAHLITADQIDHAWRFGLGSGRDRDKLAGVRWRREATGSPILDDCLAWLDCRVYDRYDGGDRIYYWADVVRGATNEPAGAAPLTDQQLFAAATDQQKQQLRRGLEMDIEIQRPLYDAWRASKR